jgi:putative flippase GtrA
MNFSTADRSARHRKLFRFLVSGGSAAALNIGVLYLCTHIAGIWYIASSVIAFVISFFASFVLQKFWTFADRTIHLVKKQLFTYLMIALINLWLNTMLLYAFVEWVHVHYVVAQIIASALLAVESYFLYQHFVFGNSNKTAVVC